MITLYELLYKWSISNIVMYDIFMNHLKWYNYISEFTTPPESTAVLLDTDLVLNCEAVDNPEGCPLNYQWHFDGKPIYQSLQRASVFVNHSLYVPRVTQDDLGEYSCVVQVTLPCSNQPSSAVESPKITVVQACKLNNDTILRHDNTFALCYTKD